MLQNEVRIWFSLPAASRQLAFGKHGRRHGLRWRVSDLKMPIGGFRSRIQAVPEQFTVQVVGRFFFSGVLGVHADLGGRKCV